MNDIWKTVSCRVHTVWFIPIGTYPVYTWCEPG